MVKIALRRNRKGSSVGRGRLHNRRLKERRHKMALGAILFVFSGVLIVIGLWQPVVRVKSISFSEKNSTLMPIVNDVLAGTYADIIPRNSIFFLPIAQIRRVILSTDKTIATVSISRTRFDAIDITVNTRIPLGRWCGTPATSTPANTITEDVIQSSSRSCYLFDGTGFLYALTDVPVVSSTGVSVTRTSTSTAGMKNIVPLVPYLIYSSLVSSQQNPLFHVISNFKKLPAVFDFVKYVDTLGVHVGTVVIRGDEGDLFLDRGTRITYVLGSEQKAATLLVAVKEKLHIADKSLIYVDLRFPGKVYFKKK